MATQFPKFKKLHGPAADMQPVPDDIVEQYRGRLPDEILAEWQTTGWCSYADGFLWLVDPAQFDDLLSDWLPDPSSSVVFLRTAFGGLIYWDGTEAILLDVTERDITPILDEMDWVFDGTLCRKPFLDDVLNRDYYLEAVPRLGRIEVDECYGFFPPKAMGGDGTPDTLKRVKVREHLLLLAAL